MSSGGVVVMRHQFERELEAEYEGAFASAAEAEFEQLMRRADAAVSRGLGRRGGAGVEAYDAPRRRSSAEHIIIGGDDRVRATGTLISDSHVLTAAHNVLEDLSNEIITTPGINPFPTRYLNATKMLVAPARN